MNFVFIFTSVVVLLILFRIVKYRFMKYNLEHAGLTLIAFVLIYNSGKETLFKPVILWLTIILCIVFTAALIMTSLKNK